MDQLAGTLTKILTKPAAQDLWQLYTELLTLDGPVESALEVAHEFYSCLNDLESKIASRGASRWGAILETSSVASVSLQEMITKKEDPLQRILATGVTAALESAAAVKNVEAWEVEANLMYHDLAWYLYGQFWELSQRVQPTLSVAERRSTVKQLIEPIRHPDTSDAVKSALLVKLFQALLLAHLWPLIQGQPKT